MYKSYTIDRKQLFAALCHVEFPALTPLRSRLELINFKNGLGLHTLSTHIFYLFEELLRIMNIKGTTMDLQDFKNLLPDESISKIERVYNTINHKCQKIDIIVFEYYLLRIDDVLLRDIMNSWKRVIKPKKNMELLYTNERKQIIEECGLTEEEYDWLERKFNILDYNNKKKIPKDDAIILFESGMIDVAKEIDLYFNYITKEEITLKEFLLYIYGPIKMQHNVLGNIVIDRQVDHNKKKRETMVINNSEDIESLITIVHNEPFEHSNPKKLKKNSGIQKMYMCMYSALRSSLKKNTNT